jgi:hypothetical protein
MSLERLMISVLSGLLGLLLFEAEYVNLKPLVRHVHVLLLRLHLSIFLFKGLYCSPTEVLFQV